jgi:hypothetical protein
VNQKRKRNAWICLGIGLLVLLSLPLLDQQLSGPVIRRFGDSMDWRSRWLMGIRGIDCGEVGVNGDPAEATTCALHAQREGEPFRVRYDIQGIDSAVAGGIVRTPSGDLFAISFDGNPHGAGYTSLLAQRSVQSVCPKPYRLWVNPKGRVNCFQQTLSYPQSLMSPNLEPY